MGCRGADGSSAMANGKRKTREKTNVFHNLRHHLSVFRGVTCCRALAKEQERGNRAFFRLPILRDRPIFCFRFRNKMPPDSFTQTLYLLAFGTKRTQSSDIAACQNQARHIGRNAP